MFNKKLLLMGVSLLLLSSFSNTAYAKESAENEVKQITYEYFSSEFKSIKNKKAIDTSNLIYDDSLKTFTNLKNSKEAIWHEKLGNELNKYSVNLTYDSINFDKDLCTINLSKDTEFSFKDEPTIVSKEFNSKHTISLKKINNKWLITNDIDKSDIDVSSANITSMVADSKNQMNKKVSILQNDLKNIDTDVKNYKQEKENFKKLRSVQSNQITALSGSSYYNRTAAVNYAHDWAKNRNPIYPNYSSDCTNFVSQAIYAGAPTSNVNAGWYCGKSGGGLAWINVDSFWTFFANNTGTGPHTTSDAPGLGDPIQLWNNYYNCYHHTIIVTKISSSGGLYYCAHTTDRYDYSLDQAYAEGSYNRSKQRSRHVTTYSY